MSSKAWMHNYNAKLACACEALSDIRNGQTVFVGSEAGEQLLLTDTLAKMCPHFCDIEVFHLAAFHRCQPPAAA